MAGPFALDEGRARSALRAMERYHRSRAEEAAAELAALGYDDPEPGPYGALDPATALTALVEDVLRPGHEHSPLSSVAGHFLQVDVVCNPEGHSEGWRLIVGVGGGVLGGGAQLADIFEERFPDASSDDLLAWLVELVDCANGIVAQAARYFTGVQGDGSA